MKKILVSACFLGQKVRYDGQHSLLQHPQIQKWQQEGRIVPFCPEIAGGLAIPRLPSEITSRHPVMVVNIQGDDVTPEFLHGAELAVEKAKETGACCALLKSRSPSCGNRETYNGEFNNTLTPCNGVTAAELLRHGIPVFNEREIDHLIEFITMQETPEDPNSNNPHSGTR
ncbi:DUF523 domain-containing protein [Neptunomonas antarctica]|uniref:Uncharacterized conserved protein YbbK, DUF523 family n=1 Tax=Neptunomonas antarctica TaxID=619304 RepID=A0A1N7JXG4_9GAMM|nr:DUF523 domain-containing protein [Neptunomonas antarctica]SIS54023.1 Uncharacterized conserved protein YbbK, DUF523 family [Neptunomonas antarctica]